MYKKTFIPPALALFLLIWCFAADATWGQGLPTASTYQEHDAVMGQMNGNGRAVRIIYIVPSDQAYRKDYKDALLDAAESVRTWFLLQLNGQTFSLFRPIVEVVYSAHPANWYSTNPNGDNSVYWFWNNALGDGFTLTGGDFNDPNYRWLYYVDADPACGQVTGGTQGVALFPKNDLRGLAGEPNVPPCSTDPPDLNGVCRWVGGLGHELGHAFDLPHPEPCLGSNYSALMCLGFITYPSTYLLPQEKTWLTTSASVKEFFLPAALPKQSKRFQCRPSPSIVAVTGPNDMAGGLNVGKQALAVGWTQAKAYARVRISATLLATGNAWPVTAYLTTRIGPAATVADEIARATVTIPFGSEYTSIVLLNVPHLAAGTYYLTLNPESGEGCTPELNCSPLAWAGTSSASVTAMPGVTFNGSFFTPSNPGPGVAAYPPASYFNVDTTTSLLFNVTGTQ